MAEMWDLDQTTQFGSFFNSRGVSTKRLEEALLIRRKEISPPVIEVEEDPAFDGPSVEDRTTYSIDLDWLQERLIQAVKAVTDHPAPINSRNGPLLVGTTSIDGRDVPCYLARALNERKGFDSADESLRAQSGLGPGIVFSGGSDAPTLIGANVVFPLNVSSEAHLSADLSRRSIELVFRAGRSLALGAGTLALIGSDEAARLHIPGREPVDLFGIHPIRAFNILVKAAREGHPVVSARELIAESNSTGFQQMFSSKRWRIVETYVEQPAPRFWKLKDF